MRNKILLKQDNFNANKIEIKAKSRKCLNFLLILLVLGSCGPTPYPDSLEGEMVQMYKDTPSHFINFFVPRNDLNSFVSCLMGQVKSKYPDYEDFMKENEYMRETYIEQASVDCIMENQNISFDNLVEMIKKNDSFARNSKYLSAQEIDEYTTTFKTELKTRFSTIQNLLIQASSKQIDLIQVLGEIDTKCGEIISSAREITRLRNLNSLITYEYGEGEVIFRNNRGTKVSGIQVVYHYEGRKWAGWVSEGSWNLENGGVIRVRIPLSSDGTMGTSIYFSGSWFGADGRLYVPSGGYGKFLMDIEGQFRIPDADSEEMMKINDKYHFSDQFKETYIGSQTTYTIDF